MAMRHASFLTCLLTLVGVAASTATNAHAHSTGVAQDRDSKTASTERSTTIAPRDAAANDTRPGEPKGERLVASIDNGSLEVVGDAKAKDTAIIASFTVDG
jgi:hypothetical protein